MHAAAYETIQATATPPLFRSPTLVYGRRVESAGGVS